MRYRTATCLIVIELILGKCARVTSEEIQISAIALPGYILSPTGSDIEVTTIRRNCTDSEPGQDSDGTECKDTENSSPDLIDLRIHNGFLDISPEIAQHWRIVLQCNASCPAQWRFYPVKEKLSNSLSSIQVTVARLVKYNESGQPYLFRHLVNLTIQSSSNEMTGKYVCECVQNSTIEKHFHIFLEERKKSLLVNSGKSIFRYPTQSSSQSWIELPCGLAKRDAPLFLFLDNVLDDAYTQVHPNASIVPDPFFGFKLNVQELPEVYSYFWVCSTTLNQTVVESGGDDTVTTMVFRDSGYNLTDYATASKPYQLPLPDMPGYLPRAACCLRTCKTCPVTDIAPPSMEAYPVRNAITAALLKPLVNQNNMRERFVEKVTHMPVRCVPVPVPVPQPGPERTNPELFEEIRERRQAVISEDDSLGYQLNCNEFVVRRLALEEVLGPCALGELPEETEGGFILKCDSNRKFSQKQYPDLISTSEYFPSLNGNRSSRIASVTRVQNTTMQIWSLRKIRLWNLAGSDTFTVIDVTRWKYFSDGTVQKFTEYQLPSDSVPDSAVAQAFSRAIMEWDQTCFDCYASAYHFADGLVWSVSWSNGSEIYSTNPNDTTLKHLYGKGLPPRISSTFCLVVRLGMERVSCYAGLWNSPAWKVVSENIKKILPIALPSIEPANQTVFQVYIGDEIELRCRFHANSTLTVQWFASERIVQEIIEPTPSCLLSQCRVLKSAYKINNFEHNYPVNFTCLGKNALGLASESFLLLPIQPTKPAILGSLEERVELTFGDVNKFLSCTATGNPKPSTMEWTKKTDYGESEPLHRNEFEDTLAGTSESKLAFPEMTMNSAGTYRCVARNKFGHIGTKSFIVTVKKPLTAHFVIAGSVLFIILIGIVFGFLLRKYKSENRELIKFEEQFRKGIPAETSDNEVSRSAAFQITLPYSDKFEKSQREWKKQRKLDHGVFGEVWQGEYRAKQIAIKCLLEDNRTLDSLKVLCSEIKVMTRVAEFGEHPNVVQFIGATTEKFQKMEVYLLMELCQEGSLKKYLAKNKNSLLFRQNDGHHIVSDRVAVWCCQIAQGMKFISDNQILHLDLAARNILLTSDLVAKVGDFGLSRYLYGKPGYKRKEVPLPLFWTALEALRDNMITTKSDVWSYGVTVWEIFSMGLDPMYSLEADSIVLTLEKGTRLSKPHYANEETYRVMQECWHQDPARRPTFSQLVEFFQTLAQELIRLQAETSTTVRSVVLKLSSDKVSKSWNNSAVAEQIESLNGNRVGNNHCGGTDIEKPSIAIDVRELNGCFSPRPDGPDPTESSIQLKHIRSPSDKTDSEQPQQSMLPQWKTESGQLQQVLSPYVTTVKQGLPEHVSPYVTTVGQGLSEHVVSPYVTTVEQGLQEHVLPYVATVEKCLPEHIVSPYVTSESI